MTIGIDTSPLNNSLHKVRGSGFYLENLRKALLKYFPDQTYIFYSNPKKIPAADVIHIPYFQPYSITLPIIKKYKTIVTVHDLTPLVFPRHFPSGIKGKAKWLIQEILLSKCDGIITDSNSSKKDISMYTGIEEDKIKVIHLAASEEFKKKNISAQKRKELEEKYNLPGKFLLYVGDATWNKNLPNLVDAVKRINLNLVIVGKVFKDPPKEKNPWNEDIFKVVKMIDGDKRFTTVGFMPTNDLVSIYNLAHVLLMPSFYEGFGLPILEAMSCGCPVIATKMGSIPEVAGKSAIFVDPYKIENMTYEIMKIFSNNTIRNKLSEDGLNQAKKFSWKKTAEETVNFYERINQ